MSYKNMFYGYNPGNIYLDNGASALALKGVKECGDAFLREYGSLHRGSGHNSEVSTARYENARESVLSHIGGGPGDTAVFTANTTDGINKFCLLYRDRMGPEDKVLVSDIEHSANSLPWRKHYNTAEFETKDFRIDPEEVARRLDEDPSIRIVAVAAASNITGYVADLGRLHRICSDRGVILFADASQYAPHFRPDLADCDVIAYCGHKMYAPFGAGVLAGRRDLLENEGYSLTGGGNVVYVGRDGKPWYKPAPFIHEAGTPNGIGAVTLARAHEILYDEIGNGALAAHNAALCGEIREQAARLEKEGYNVFFCGGEGPRTPVMIIDSLRMSNPETVRLLNTPVGEYTKPVFLREGAFCAYRIIERLKPELRLLESPVRDGKLDPGYSLIRLSAGMINDPEDIRYAADKLIAIARAA